MALPPVMKNKSKGVKSASGAKGGSTSMQKRQFTGQQKPGVSSQEHSKSGGIGAKGGSTKMFGKQTVKAVKPA